MRIPDEERPHFSNAQLICYLQCPLQYHFQYELGIAWDRMPSAVMFGDCIHQAVEVANTQLMNGGLDVSQAILAYHRSWSDSLKTQEIAWKEDPNELYAKGRELLTLYCETMKGEKPTEVELAFRLPLVDPSTGLFVASRDMVGKIDAIFTDDTIVEVKTTARSPVQQEVDRNVQLTLYSWAYRMLFGKPERAIKVINLVKTKEPKVVISETLRTERDHSWLIATITQVIRAIDSQLFYPNPIGGFGCFNCQYQSHCKDDEPLVREVTEDAHNVL